MRSLYFIEIEKSRKEFYTLLRRKLSEKQIVKEEFKSNEALQEPIYRPERTTVQKKMAKKRFSTVMDSFAKYVNSMDEQSTR